MLQVLQRLDAAQQASTAAPLRDHISWCHHLDDHLRICHIPKQKGANFRSLPGVKSWDDGNCSATAGHICAVAFQPLGVVCPSSPVLCQFVKGPGPLLWLSCILESSSACCPQKQR